MTLPKLDDTHDARLRSFVEAANDAAGDFPVQNLPVGVFRRGGARPARIGCAIGDAVLDLLACAERGLLRGLPTEVEDACRTSGLNALMAIEPRVRGTLRHRLSHLLRADGGFVTARNDAARGRSCAAPTPRCCCRRRIGDYTDFYASIHHATNVGTMLRPDNPLLPNYKWVPIGYHGRASSLVVSGTPVRRPCGPDEARRRRDRAGVRPEPARSTTSSRSGSSSAPATRSASRSRSRDAEDHVFGLCLVNDWSARDIQTWEYQPLGPFLGEELRHDALALGRDDSRRSHRSAAPLSTATGGRSRAAAVPARTRPTSRTAAIDLRLEVRLVTTRPCASARDCAVIV